MAIGQFYGSALPKMHKGKRLTGAFEQIDSFFPVGNPVEFGALVKFTSNKKYYETMVGDETDANLFAGIATAELVVAGTTYPGTKTRYEVGEPANVLIQGCIAVELDADADAGNIIEGGKVYMSAAGKVTPEADDGATPTANNHLLLPNLVFTGDVETIDGETLVGVRKLY